MTESILLDVQRGVVHTIQQAVRSWNGEQHHARFAHHVTEVVSVCLRWPDELAKAIQTLWKAAVANLLDDHQKTGEQVLDLFDNGLRLLKVLLEKTNELERNGLSVPNATELPGTIEKMSLMRQDFVDRWLWVNDEILQEAKAEYARGEFQTVREIMDELQGKTP